MRKIILLGCVTMLSVSGFSQKVMHGHGIKQSVPATAARTTGAGDTLVLTNIAPANTTRVLYTHAAPGSGYTSGMNSFNDKGFAERYYFSAADSSVRIIGVLAQFGGTVTAGSTKTVTLRAWSQGSPTMITARHYYQGFPGKLIDSIVVPVTQLGIGPSADTLKQFMFATPSAALSDPFFVGFTSNYNYTTLAGDTVALAVTTDGSRTAADTTLRYNRGTAGDTVSVDTLHSVQNATLWTDNIWRDNYSQNDSLYNNLAIFPIVIIGNPTGVGVTRNGLTLSGAWPNPANTSVSIGFATDRIADVEVSLIDMSGRIVYTENRKYLNAGAHTVQIATANLPSGAYTYLVRTASGTGIAGRLLIAQ